MEVEGTDNVQILPVRTKVYGYLHHLVDLQAQLGFPPVYMLRAVTDILYCHLEVIRSTF